MEINNPKGVIIVDEDDLILVSEKTPYITSHGYVKIRVNGKQEYLHRFLLQAKPGEQIDHINRNRLDCRKSNLRKCTGSQNRCNVTRYKNNQSGFKGVYLCKCTGRWRAEIRFDNVKYKLGRYDTLEEAVKAYDSASFKLHGNFGLSNQVIGNEK